MSELSDRGADGQAAQARPLVELEIQRRLSATRSVKETRRAYADTWCIDALHHRGLLTDQHWEAGRRFRVLWVVACGHPCVTGPYEERPRGYRDPDAVPRVVERGNELREVLSVLGKLGQIRSAAVIEAVVGVCGMDEAVSRRGKVLREGLDALAEWWGIGADHKKRAISF